jgi:hypothetical protein
MSDEPKNGRTDYEKDSDIYMFAVIAINDPGGPGGDFN